MKPARIELHIEELVLHGFAPGDRHRIGDAIERELARLIAEAPPSFDRGAGIERLELTPISVSPGADAGAVGRGIARALHGGLKQ